MTETVSAIRERVALGQHNYDSNLKTIEDILLNERGYVSKSPVNEDVVVVYSGGLDSTVMLNIVIEDWNVKVHPLYIRRGAAAEKFEEEAFDYFVDFYRQRYPENVGEAAKLDCKIPPLEFKENFPKELAETVGHPLRNSTIDNLAVMYAVALNGKYGLDIHTVLTGSVGDDSTEPEAGLLSLRAQTLNTCIQLGDWQWQITAPMTDPELGDVLYKANLIKYAAAKEIPLGKTRTCFSDNELADGTCIGCRKRLEAFNVAGARDTIHYANGGASK